MQVEVALEVHVELSQTDAAERCVGVSRGDDASPQRVHQFLHGAGRRIGSAQFDAFVTEQRELPRVLVMELAVDLVAGERGEGPHPVLPSAFREERHAPGVLVGLEHLDEPRKLPRIEAVDDGRIGCGRDRLRLGRPGRTDNKGERGKCRRRRTTYAGSG